MDGDDQLTCIPEIIKIDATLRRAIADEQSTDRLQEIALANGTVPLAVTAQLRAALGVTTIEEIIRVLPDCDTEARPLSFQQSAGSSRLDTIDVNAKSPARYLPTNGPTNGSALDAETSVNAMS